MLSGLPMSRNSLQDDTYHIRTTSLPVKAFLSDLWVSHVLIRLWDFFRMNANHVPQTLASCDSCWARIPRPWSPCFAGSATEPISLLHNSDDLTDDIEYICNPPLAPLKERPRFKHVQRVYDDERWAPWVPTSQSSTQRDPSSFEWVEGVPGRSKRCGVCKASGHNSRTCPRASEIWAAIIEVDQTL